MTEPGPQSKRADAIGVAFIVLAAAAIILGLLSSSPAAAQTDPCFPGTGTSIRGAGSSGSGGVPSGSLPRTGLSSGLVVAGVTCVVAGSALLLARRGPKARIALLSLGALAAVLTTASSASAQPVCTPGASGGNSPIVGGTSETNPAFGPGPTGTGAGLVSAATTTPSVGGTGTGTTTTVAGGTGTTTTTAGGGTGTTTTVAGGTGTTTTTAGGGTGTTTTVAGGGTTTTTAGGGTGTTTTTAAGGTTTTTAAGGTTTTTRPGGQPDPVIPEAPLAALIPVAGLVLIALSIKRSRAASNR